MPIIPHAFYPYPHPYPTTSSPTLHQVTHANNHLCTLHYFLPCSYIINADGLFESWAQEAGVRKQKNETRKKDGVIKLDPAVGPWLNSQRTCRNNVSELPLEGREARAFVPQLSKPLARGCLLERDTPVVSQVLSWTLEAEQQRDTEAHT